MGIKLRIAVNCTRHLFDFDLETVLHSNVDESEERKWDKPILNMLSYADVLANWHLLEASKTHHIYIIKR